MIKAPTTFSRYKLPLLFENVKDAVDKLLHKELPQCSGYGFSTDIWSSRNNDSYMALSFHYISESFELRKFIIACSYFDGHHTGDAISAKLEQ